MEKNTQVQLRSAVFITFSGNCKEALMFYHSCFGGELHFDTFESSLQGYQDLPVISASLISDRVVIYASDLVHNEGRKTGNYISVFLSCRNSDERRGLIGKLQSDSDYKGGKNDGEDKLIEVTDAYDVKWVLAC